MLTRGEIATQAGRHGFGDHADRLIGRLRPGWDLDPEPGVPGPGTSKVGGHPDLGPDEAWPLNDRGVPLVFLAQIDTAGLPSLGEWGDRVDWPHEGRLVRVFADLLDSPFEPGPATVLITGPGGEWARTPAPPVSQPFPPGGPARDLPADERFHVLAEAAVRPLPLLTAPELDPELKPEEFAFTDLSDAYDDWARGVRDLADEDDEAGIWVGHHHLLGEALSVQGDVREIGPAVRPEVDDAEDWRVLLCLNSDDRIGLEILDGGAFTVLIPAADLAVGRYDRLVCSVDSC